MFRLQCIALPFSNSTSANTQIPLECFPHFLLWVKNSIRFTCLVAFHSYAISRLAAGGCIKWFTLMWLITINETFKSLYQSCLLTKTYLLEAQRTIPADSIPFILAGFKLHNTITIRLSISD